ncbi:MAG: hypothetical protein PUA93_01255 [Eubacteriales bacterium]|nr:hypothetical protein [Eubacteriales bacterium]
MPWYLILILIIGFGYGLFLLAVGGKESVEAIKEKRSFQHLGTPRYSLFHIAGAPTTEKEPLKIVYPTDSLSDQKERKEDKD